MSKIPKASRTETQVIPEAKRLHMTDDGIVFSFEALERTEYFNLDGTCQNWANGMLDMCKEISKLTVRQLTSGSFGTYRFHNQRKAKNCPSPLPEGVELKDIYQMRISASKGGIHGVLRENCFYVIWLDPLHNMYPDDRFGGLRKVRAASTCCKDRDDEILRLQEKLTQAKKEAAEWEQLAQDFEKEHESELPINLQLNQN